MVFCYGLIGEECLFDDSGIESRAQTHILTDGRLDDSTAGEGFTRQSPLDTNSRADWFLPTAVHMATAAITTQFLPTAPFIIAFFALFIGTVFLLRRQWRS